MAAPIGALRAELSAGHAQFASDMKKAKNAVKTNASGMAAAMSKVSKKFTQAATALNRYAGFAMVAATVAAGIFIKKQIDIADKMGKLAQSTGTTSEYLSSMALVASQGGTTLEVVAKSLNKLSKNMSDVRLNIGEAKDAFEELNIHVTESNGTLRSSDEVMKDIADRFKGMQDGADKTAYAMQIFGKAGTELIPMLNGGRIGMERLQKKAEEMGLVISTKTALDAADLNDQLDILMKTAQGAGRGIALDLIPWLNETLVVMKLAKEESGTLMAAWVGLGSVGNAIFGKSLQQKINQTKKTIEDLEETIKNRSKLDLFALKFAKGDFVIKRIEDLKKDLAELEAQQEKEDNADKARREGLIKRLREEADERRKNTEAIRKDRQAKLDVAIATKEKELAEKQAYAATDKAMAQLIVDVDEGIKATEESQKAIEDQITALKEQRDTYGDTSGEIALYHLKLQGATKAQLEQAKAIIDTTEAYTAADEAIAQLMDNVEEGTKDSIKGLKDLGDTGKDVFTELKQTIEGWGRDSADAITKFALTGEMTFSDMVDSMIQDLIRMMIYQKITGPLFSSISGLFGSAKGNAFQGGKVLPFAKGGIVTHPTIFPMAQGAGLMGEAGPEAVLSLKRDAGGNLGVAGGNPIINIYNNVGADVKTSERKTAGGMELDVFIDQAVAKKLGQFGSNSNKAMRQSFGASQRLTGR